MRVVGTANGYVTVTCKVAEYGQPNVAMEDVHYYLTSPTINIADGDNSGYFEFNLVDNREINESKFFQITLVNAQGATIGTNNTTVVEIEDNDDKPYDRLDGEWLAVYKNGNNEETKLVTLSSYDSDHYAYGMSYRLFGIFGENDTYEDENGNYHDGVYPVTVMFHYNEATQEGDITIAMDQTLGSIKVDDIMKPLKLMGFSETQGYVFSGKLALTWTEDIDELYITETPFGDTDMMSLGIYYDNTIVDMFENFICLKRRN